MSRRIALIFGTYGALTGAFFALWQAKLLERGYGVTEIAALIALETTLSIALEIPTGILADRTGPKRLLVAGFGLLALGFFLPVSSSTAFALAVAAIVFGVADSCINGALDSFANEALAPQNLMLSYVDREHWSGRGRILGALLIPTLGSLMGEPVQTLWIPFVALSGVALALTLKTAAPHRPTQSIPSFRALALESLSIHRHIREVASEHSGKLLLISSAIFGITEAATSIGFRPRVIELGIQASWMLGAIQVLLTGARLSGLGLYRRAGLLTHAKTATISLILSSVLYAGFALIDSAWAAIPLWLLRVAVLSAYFPTLKLAITETSFGAKNLASALSVLTVVSSLGTIVFSSLLASSLASELGTKYTLLAGAVASVIAGLVLSSAKQKGHATP